jgi:hypothetical protein
MSLLDVRSIETYSPKQAVPSEGGVLSKVIDLRR